MRPDLLLLPALLSSGLMACNPIADLGRGPFAPAIPPGEVRVTRVQATPSTVTVRLSDGARCDGVRPEGSQGGWSGVTDPACGYALPYIVTFKEGASAQRFTIEAAPAGLGPRAEVFVTDVDGVRRLFAAPLGRGVTFEPASAPAI